VNYPIIMPPVREMARLDCAPPRKCRGDGGSVKRTRLVVKSLSEGGARSEPWAVSAWSVSSAVPSGSVADVEFREVEQPMN